jgi:hypothetical protein
MTPIVFIGTYPFQASGNSYTDIATAFAYPGGTLSGSVRISFGSNYVQIYSAGNPSGYTLGFSSAIIIGY